ncbi:unannotated protein [freshwater metagenome]|uniref:Unannotated protein n=1 Tax=freshwater metagenome TaxID=449393 RepID=A0A6J6TM53_9ZZZZ
MIAKTSSAAVGAKSRIEFMIAPVTPPSGTVATPLAWAMIAKTPGTRMSAMTGVVRLVRIKNMNTAIIATPKNTITAMHLESRRNWLGSFREVSCYRCETSSGWTCRNVSRVDQARSGDLHW